MISHFLFYGWKGVKMQVFVCDEVVRNDMCVPFGCDIQTCIPSGVKSIMTDFGGAELR